jgi:hypothetical protein
MTSDPYIRWAEESGQHLRRQVFFEDLAAIPKKVVGFITAAVVAGWFLGIAFSVAREVASFAYGASPALQCFPLVDGYRGDVAKQ